METDKITIQDLNIFNTDEGGSVFNRIDFTITAPGKEKLIAHLTQPGTGYSWVVEMQQVVACLIEKLPSWPTRITNGTVLMIDRFYETALNTIPEQVGKYNSFFYRIFNKSDHSLIRFSVVHCFDLLKGLREITDIFVNAGSPEILKKKLNRIHELLQQQELQFLFQKNNAEQLSNAETLQLAYYLRYRYKHPIRELMKIHAELDAWYSMAKATVELQLHFPQFIDTPQPVLRISNLRHLLLDHPIPYDIEMNQQRHFIFLTGANMAGKSTFIKSLGIAVFMAHAGMGVPAASMQLSVFDGLLSNINIMDNLVKGESYFYNEVQRIKSTIQRIHDGRKWLVLIDELFKGTNVEDAMKCSQAVIEGMLQIKGSLIVLSTHLYEIAKQLPTNSHIQFRFFETTVTNEQFSFSYQLKEGVSNDRLGYLILKKEGVVDMLQQLNNPPS